MNSHMSDLETLYRVLDIDVNRLSSKSPSFSSNTPDSALSPIPVNGENRVSLEKEKAQFFHVKKDLRFASSDDTSVFAYEPHPLIDLATEKEVRHKCSGCDNMKCDDCSGTRPKWSILTHVYIGSITVVALYAMFRAIQRSK